MEEGFGFSASRAVLDCSKILSDLMILFDCSGDRETGTGKDSGLMPWYWQCF